MASAISSEYLQTGSDGIGFIIQVHMKITSAPLLTISFAWRIASLPGQPLHEVIPMISISSSEYGANLPDLSLIALKQDVPGQVLVALSHRISPTLTYYIAFKIEYLNR